MTTLNPRISVTFEMETAKLLAELAHHEHKSISRLSKELIMDALERREDMALSALADIREIKTTKRIKREDVWK
jgi:hypothetical protein